MVNIGKLNLLKKFFSKCTLLDNGCLEWKGMGVPPILYMRKYGYKRKSSLTVNRAIYSILNNRVLTTKTLIKNTCNNVICCNPHHLYEISVSAVRKLATKTSTKDRLDTIKNLLLEGKTTKQICIKLGLRSIKYWVDKFNLIPSTNLAPKQCLCKTCGSSDPTIFAFDNKVTCKPCCNIRSREKCIATRAKAKEILGNKCAHCGYNEHLVCLDFHHLDPEHKDPTFASMGSWAWNKVLKEIEKCILLCKNCHAAYHFAGLEIAGLRPYDISKHTNGKRQR